jgi:glycosyltransferase involved in cell wall biosynthesis
MKIRILMITASSGYGGGPQHIYDLAKSLRNKVTVDIACPKQEPFYTRFKDVIDGKIIVIPERRFSFNYAFKVLFFILKNKVRVIHSHGKGAGIYGRFLSILTLLPLIHTAHGIHIDQYGKLMRLFYIFYERLTASITKHDIFVSESELNKAIGMKFSNLSKSTLVLNGVDSYPIVYKDIRKEMRDIHGVAENEIIVISLSRFDFAKNMSEMLELAKLNVGIKFWLLGDGKDYDLVKNNIKFFNVTNVFLPGFINNPLDYLRAADIYCSTSRWEGLPLAVLQAMSLAIPVVASNVIGNKDAVIDGETGYLYHLGNVIDGASYIEKLAKNP